MFVNKKYSNIVLEMLNYNLTNEEYNIIRSKIAESEWEEYFNILSLKREHDLNQLDHHMRFDENAVYWNHKKPKIDEKLNKFNNNNEFKIVFTHDIDWITPFEPISIIKSLTSKNWIPFYKCFSNNLFYDNLIKTWEYENSKGIKSINFFIADKYGIGRYDTRYSINWDITKKSILKCNEIGHKIGLHGSYYAKDKNSYSQEKMNLEKITNNKIDFHRNHYLRFDTKKGFNQLEQANFKYDFSIGYISKAGFRAGTTKMYRPFNWETGQVSSIKEIPLLIMERLNYLDDMEDSLSEFEKLLGEVKKYNGCMAILTHPDLFLVNPKWWEFYKNIIDITKKWAQIFLEI
jgi:hypothetical protein